jgi:hypothetical protein
MLHCRMVLLHNGTVLNKGTALQDGAALQNVMLQKMVLPPFVLILLTKDMFSKTKQP